MMFAAQYKAKGGEIKGHLFKILYRGLSEHIDLRTKLGSANKYEEYMEVVEEMIKRRKDVKLEEKFGWYLRY